MALQRSRTAPQPLPALALATTSSPGRLARSSSSSAITAKFPVHHKTVYSPPPFTPLTETDPFNLSGFYPPVESDTLEDEFSDEFVEEDASQAKPSATKSRFTQPEDAEMVIAKEDKFGILSLNTDLFRFNERGLEADEKILSPYRVEDTAVDDESLYQALLRQRAQKSAVQIAGDVKPIEGKLFFGEDSQETVPAVNSWLGRILA